MHGVVFKITYPNGKIYVGKDETNSITYFGSANADLVALDFTQEQRRTFSVTREILWESMDTSRSEINAVEVSFITQLCSNDPEVGYNRWPRLQRGIENGLASQ